MEFLEKYCELSLAFVAFTTIVATFRQAHGEQFGPLQYVMFRFFVESGLIHFVSAFVPLILLYLNIEEAVVWQLGLAFILLELSLYLPYHLRRRRRLGVAMPLVSRVTTAGYVVLAAVMISALVEAWWQPSLTLLAAVLTWGLVTNGLIFVHFLGAFVEKKDA
jgi:hypothetical protein